MSAKKCIAVMTSGGDAQGMNAAVRAVVRTGIALGVDVYAICEGYQGMYEGRIKKMDWSSVSGIMDKGGTEIGTARSQEFRTREGRLIAAKNLVNHGIDNLVVIGGDGSLTGANQFREEWTELLEELEKNGDITAELKAKHPALRIVGMVGSIDNDMANTDMTIGADSALHRIAEALDAISSTAASHQRTFVVEVMGRNCGYLALMAAIAGNAAWLLIPEFPPKEGWEKRMCDLISEGHARGKRGGVVIVAEGAKDRNGTPITSNYVKEVLDNGLGIPCRVTILGHVQRGGIPSAFDRYMSTIFGYTAVKELVRENASSESQLVVMRRNRVSCAPLMESVNKTRAIATAIESRDFDAAKELRGASWEVMKNIYRTMILAEPREASERDNMRIGVMTCGHPAPGMNAAVRTVTRIGLDRDHTVLGIMDGMAGLAEGRVEELNWMQVENWFNMGGSRIGTNRKVPEHSDFYGIAKTIEDFKIQGIIMIGGWDGYESVCRLFQRREDFPAFNIPFVMIPASISNNLPGSELSIGSDTALNNIVEVIDKIKFSADSSRRAYVIEVMGKFCGYLALMSGLATGAETIYIPERGITLEGLKNEAEWLKNSFLARRTQALVINNEKANKTYTTDFITSLLEEEGGDVFDVRKTILGPLQQGGEPTPFDRIQGTRLGYEGLELLLDLIERGSRECKFLGFCGGHASVHDIREMSAMCTDDKQRPLCQWWEGLMEVAMLLARDPD